MKSFNKTRSNIQALDKKIKQALGLRLGMVLLSPLALAVKVSGWLSNHHLTLLAWLAIILILGGTGFAVAAAAIALVSLFTSFSWPVMIIAGTVGGLALDAVLIYLDFQVAKF